MQDADISADRSAFKEMVGYCLDHDDRIKGYFERRFVSRDKVLEMLAEGDAFDQAVRASPRSKVISRGWIKGK